MSTKGGCSGISTSGEILSGIGGGCSWAVSGVSLSKSSVSSQIDSSKSASRSRLSGDVTSARSATPVSKFSWGGTSSTSTGLVGGDKSDFSHCDNSASAAKEFNRNQKRSCSFKAWKSLSTSFGLSTTGSLGGTSIDCISGSGASSHSVSSQSLHSESALGVTISSVLVASEVSSGKSAVDSEGSGVSRASSVSDGESATGTEESENWVASKAVEAESGGGAVSSSEVASSNCRITSWSCCSSVVSSAVSAGGACGVGAERSSVRVTGGACTTMSSCFTSTGLEALRAGGDSVEATGSTLGSLGSWREDF